MYNKNSGNQLIADCPRRHLRFSADSLPPEPCFKLALPWRSRQAKHLAEVGAKTRDRISEGMPIENVVKLHTKCEAVLAVSAHLEVLV